MSILDAEIPGLAVAERHLARARRVADEAVQACCIARTRLAGAVLELPEDVQTDLRAASAAIAPLQLEFQLALNTGRSAYLELFDLECQVSLAREIQRLKRERAHLAQEILDMEGRGG